MKSRFGHRSPKFHCITLRTHSSPNKLPFEKYKKKWISLYVSYVIVELDGSRLQSIKEKQVVHVHTILYFSSLFLIKKLNFITHVNTHLLLLHNAFGSYQFYLRSCNWCPFPSLLIIFFNFFLSIFLLYFLLFLGFFYCIIEATTLLLAYHLEPS